MVSREQFEQANARATRRRKARPATVKASYNRQTKRIVVTLNTGLEVAFPPELVQGLENAKASELEPIEISPSGFGMHFPKLDADVYLPALLQGVLGSRQWMASELGRAGGSVRSAATTAASRDNGRRGGRPRKDATG
jgi:hypothetical protein